MFRNIAVLLLAASVSTACSSERESNSSPPATAATVTPSATPKGQSESNASPIPATRPDEAAGSAGSFEGTSGITEKRNLNVNESVVAAYVRSARHDGFDRVVFEFLGDQLPTYKIEYIDKPVRSCGSGDVVSFAGDAWISVRFTGAQAHAPEGDATIPVEHRTQSPNLPIVKDLKMICDFEGEVEWVMGVSSPNKYRVLELRAPTRLVVDVKH